MRLTAFALALLPALVVSAPVHSAEDTPSARAKTRAAEASEVKATSQRSATQKTQPKAPVAASADTAKAAPFNPRWVAPKVQMKGLVVWVFTPGHFQRD